MYHDTPEGDESDDSASLSTHHSPTAIAGDQNGQVEGPKGFGGASYNRLPYSLDVDAGLTPIPEASFDVHQMTAPMDTSRGRMAKRQWTKPEEVDTEAWLRLVVEGGDPPHALFDAGPAGFDLPDLVSRSTDGTSRA
jgi:hypothetical protein